MYNKLTAQTTSLHMYTVHLNKWMQILVEIVGMPIIADYISLYSPSITRQVLNNMMIIDKVSVKLLNCCMMTHHQHYYLWLFIAKPPTLAL